MYFTNTDGRNRYTIRGGLDDVDRKLIKSLIKLKQNEYIFLSFLFYIPGISGA